MRVVRARPDELLPALADALDGGEPVLPLPADGALAARILAVVRPDEPVEPGTALIVPTSGSTGEPKGVLLSAGALRASALATIERLGGPGTWDLRLPVTHIAGVQVLVRGLLAPGPRRYTAMVPTQLRRALASGEDLSGYDAILLGGAAAPPDLLELGLPVVTTYGMSETAGGCVYDGVPLPGAVVSVGDLDRRFGPKITNVGRVRLGGPMVALGYRLRPDLTAEAFVDGEFWTEDLGRRVDGRLEILGRVDDMIITGGENVAPAAVEAALLAHPSVRDVVVLGVTDAEWGQRVVACVVLSSPLSLDEVREHVAASQGRVSAPRELRVLPEIPLLATGKPDRVALRAGRPGVIMNGGR